MRVGVKKSTVYRGRQNLIFIILPFLATPNKSENCSDGHPGKWSSSACMVVTQSTTNRTDPLSLARECCWSCCQTLMQQGGCTNCPRIRFVEGCRHGKRGKYFSAKPAASNDLKPSVMQCQDLTFMRQRTAPPKRSHPYFRLRPNPTVVVTKSTRTRKLTVVCHKWSEKLLRSIAVSVLLVQTL